MKKFVLDLEDQVLESLTFLAVNFWKSPHGIWSRIAAQNLALHFYLGKRTEEVWAWIAVWLKLPKEAPRVFFFIGFILYLFEVNFVTWKSLICKVNLIYFESNIKILTFKTYSKYKVTFLKSFWKQLVRNRYSKYNIPGGVLQYPFSKFPSSRRIKKEKSLTLFKQTQTFCYKAKR